MLLDSMQYGRAMDAASKEFKDTQEQAQKEADKGIIVKFKVDTSSLKDAQTAMDQLRFLQAMEMEMGGPAKTVSTPVGATTPSSLGISSLPTATTGMTDLVANMSISDLAAAEPLSMATSEPIDISPMVDALSDIRDSMEDLVANTDPDNAAEPFVLKPLGLRG
jgi:hypothetical protein